MAGFDNEVVYMSGERLEPSQALSITLMQQTATDVARINYTGDPEGNVAANPSSLCHDPSSGLIYRKVSGTGNTGWEQIPDSSQTLLQVTTDSGIATVNAGNLNMITTATSGIDTSGSGDDIHIMMATPYADGDFEFRSEVSGQTRSLSVTNTSNTASSQAQINTSVAGTSSGDTWNQYTVGSTRSYAQGIDNSDTQKLKLTTAASATVNPSTATPIWSFTPAAGFNYDNSGTSGFGIGFGQDPDTNYAVKMTKSANATFGIQINNSNSGASALSAINFVNDTPVGLSIGVPSSASTIAAVRDKLFINGNHASSPGIVYNTRATGTHAFYADVAAAGLIMTAASTGLTMSTPLTIGTQEIFTTRQTTPSAGTIGEQLVSFIPPASAVSMSTGSTTNITSLSLTAGVWDVTFNLVLGGGEITGTIIQMGISATSVTMPATTETGRSRLNFTGPFPSAATDQGFSLPNYRLILTSTTTYYAVAAAAYTVGALVGGGILKAVRVA